MNRLAHYPIFPTWNRWWVWNFEQEGSYSAKQVVPLARCSNGLCLFYRSFTVHSRQRDAQSCSIPANLPRDLLDRLVFRWPLLSVNVSVCLSVVSISCRKRWPILTKLGSYYCSMTRLRAFHFGHPTCPGCHIISQKLSKSANITLSAVTREILQLEKPDCVLNNPQLTFQRELPFIFC